MHPFDLLAGSCSVSFVERLDGATLEAILREGRFDARWTGQVAALIEEAPIDTLARAVGAFHPTSGRACWTGCVLWAERWGRIGSSGG